MIGSSLTTRVARAEPRALRARQAAGIVLSLIALSLCAGTSAAARPDTPESAGFLAANTVAQISPEQRSLGPAPSTPRDSRPTEGVVQRENWITQTVLALGGVLALAIVGGAAVRILARGHGGLRASLGAGGRSPAGILEVIGRYPIARGSSLVLLKLDRRMLLLSQTAQGRLGAGAAFTTLCEIDDPEEVASILVKARDADGDSMSERFRSMLGRFDRNIEAAVDEGMPDGRLRRVTAAGDRVEFWDDGRGEIPLVDLTRERPPGEAAGPIASLRQRLASLRATDGGRAV